MTGPSLTRGALLVSLSNVAARGLGLLSALAVAALLIPRDFGVFSLLTVTSALVSAFGLLGFPTLTTRAIASCSSREDAVLLASRALQRCTACLLAAATVVIVACHPTWAFLPLKGASSTDVFLTAAWAVALGLNPLFLAIATGFRQFGASGALNVSRSALVVAGTVGGCLVTGSGASSAIAGAVVGEWTACAVSALVAWRAGWICRRPEGDVRTGDLLAFRATAVAGLVALLVQLATWSGQYVLSKQDGGLVAVGVFLLLVRMSLAVTLVPNSFATVMLPLLSTPQDDQSGRATTRRALIAVGVSVAVTAALMSILGGPLLRALDDDYADFDGALWVMALVASLMAANNVLGSIVVAKGRIRQWIRSDVVLAVSMATGAILVVPQLGIEGLALTHLASYGLSVVYLFVVQQRHPEVG